MHVRSGEVREDAVDVDAADGTIVAVVADGHGTRRAFRAHIGSELGVRAAIEAARADQTSWESTSDAEAARWVAERFTPELVDRWRSLVQDHVREHPLTPDEVPGSALSTEELWLAYGSTVLVAILTPHRGLLWQLGDGDIVSGTPAALAGITVAADPHNHGNQTSSICMPDAAARARSVLLPLGAEPMFVVLATDGFGNAMASTDWRTRLIDDLHAQRAEHGFDDIAESLPSWCRQCAQASGDDVSVVALLHDPDPSPAVTGSPSPGSLPSQATPKPGTPSAPTP